MANLAIQLLLPMKIMVINYLLGLAVLDNDAGGHPDLPDVFLAKEVPDLDEGAGL